MPSPIESLRALEAQVRETRQAYQGSMGMRGMADLSPVLNAEEALTNAVDPLIPELLALWEACQDELMGRGLPCLGYHVINALDALNARAGEVKHG